MELSRIAAALEINEADEGFEATFGEWETSQAQAPPGAPDYVEPHNLTSWCAFAGIADEVRPLLLHVAANVENDPVLHSLAWHYHWLLFRSGDFARESVRHWPSLKNILGPQEGIFYLLVLMSGLPGLRRIYDQRGIPRSVIVDTLKDITVWLGDYRRRFGVFGLSLGGLRWLMNHFQGNLYHLVRLQFIPGPFWGRLRVYRNVRDGRVVALSEGEVSYRSDGQVNGAGNVEDPEAVEALFEETAESVLGFPIHPTGYAIRRTVQLPRAEWRQVLAPGDPTLHIHIPEGGPMDFDECGASLRAALRFFPRHFPDRPFVAFTCGSWLLDPQFEVIMPSRSNIVRFQREGYLFPIRSTSRSTLSRVFGYVPEDLHAAPRDTTMRRAILDHLLAGGHFRGGGWFILPDDLNWGQQVYRNQGLPLDELEVS